MKEVPDEGRLGQLETSVIIESESAPISAAETRRLLRSLFKRLNIPHRSVAVLYGADERIRGLNSRFRGVDRPTDVLSFPSGDYEHLGDIAISSEAVRRQARARGWSAPAETRSLLIHGILHLLGYDHETDDGEMEAMEKTLRWELRQSKALGR
jgi:probable rRNA maturation factor